MKLKLFHLLWIILFIGILVFRGDTGSRGQNPRRHHAD